MARNASIRNRSNAADDVVKKVAFTSSDFDDESRFNVVTAPADVQIKNEMAPKPGPHDRVQEPEPSHDDLKLFEGLRHEEIERIKSLQRELIKSQQMYDVVVGLEGRLKWRKEIEKVKKEIDRVKKAAQLEVPLG
ncbi:MAG TPA: hypothetical protein VL860_13585 [Planctomycetota bacterium]|nr:hypothetical protein [Planctomycetota bacterium]